MRRAWPLLAALLGAATLLDLGALHRLEHADAVVPVLVSLQRFTPLYWDQERYGMLVPLLAWPVRDPFWNLLLQRGLLVLAGLAAVVLLARHALGGRAASLAGSAWPLAGAAAAALLLLLAPPAWRFEYLGDQPYGLGLALALLGLAVALPMDAEGAPAAAGRGRLAAGLTLVLLAAWVNAATAVPLLLLTAARAAAAGLGGAGWRSLPRRFGVEAGLLAVSLAAGQLSITLYPVVTGKPLRLTAGFLPVGEWPRAVAAILARARVEAPAWAPALAGRALLGPALLSLPPCREGRREALLRAGALLAAAAAYVVFAGSLRWVDENQSHPRYLAPAALLVHLAAVSLVAAALSRLAPLARPALAAALLGLPLAAVAVGGPPSVAGVRADLDRAFGAFTEDILAGRCDAVSGDYWAVWPAVWHANLVARERGLDREVYGLCHRAGPTLGRWLHPPWEQVRICRLGGTGAKRPALAERWHRVYHAWPVTRLERRDTLEVVGLVPPLE